MVDGGRVIKPFIASELGGCSDTPRGLKFTRARESLQAKGVPQLPPPRQFEHWSTSPLRQFEPN